MSFHPGFNHTFFLGDSVDCWTVHRNKPGYDWGGSQIVTPTYPPAPLQPSLPAMRLPLPADFFVPVRLSTAEVYDFHRVETHLLSVYLSSYDMHVEGAPSSVWQLKGQRAGVKIFRHRSKTKRHKTEKQPQCGGILESEPENGTEKLIGRPGVEERDLPALRLVGSVDGTLEDVLYGTMWISGRERAARAHVTGDGVVDGAVLCSVDKPSRTDPFRSLRVKWALKRAPHGGLVVKDRDFCYLAATGIVHSPRTGARLGYRLRHSILFPSCPPFQNHSVVRGQIFLCSFFRQLRNGKVEVFHEGTYDVGGGTGIIGLQLPKSMAEKRIVETLLSLEKVRACALAKKLARAVEKNEADRAVASIASTSVQESVDGERRCGMCLRHLGSALKRRCAACHDWTCSQCSVRQEVIHSTRCTWMKGPMLARCFCKACVAKVLRNDAAQYASRDAKEDDYEVKSGRWDHDDIPEEDENENNEVCMPSLRHSMALFSAEPHHSEVQYVSFQHRVMTMSTALPCNTENGFQPFAYRLPAKPLSVRSDPMNTVDSSSLDDHRWRSATLSDVPATTSERHNLERTRPRRRVSVNVPDILLRSDVGKRNWASSTSALSLESPQRHVDGSPIVNLHRNRRCRWSRNDSPSVHRVSFGSNGSSSGKSDEVRVQVVTPKRSRPAAAYTPYFASAKVISRKQSPDAGPSSSIRAVHNHFFRELYGDRGLKSHV